MADPIVMTSEDYEDHRDNYDGYCLACGEWTDGGVEPDARGYECDCGARQVYGCEEIMIMGLIIIED